MIRRLCSGMHGHPATAAVKVGVLLATCYPAAYGVPLSRPCELIAFHELLPVLLESMSCCLCCWSPKDVKYRAK